MTKVWAVVPTQGREVFWEALRAAVAQCDGVIVVPNNGFIIDPVPGVRVVRPSSDTNIHVWWNAGLDAAPSDAHVLVLNDDCVLGPDAVRLLSEALDTSDAEISHPHIPDGRERMTGWCWMLRAGSALRADESFGWWWGDDDLERRAAGVVPVRGVDVEHRFPNVLTNTDQRLQDQAWQDRQTFIRKWGSA